MSWKHWFIRESWLVISSCSDVKKRSFSADAAIRLKISLMAIGRAPPFGFSMPIRRAVRIQFGAKPLAIRVSTDAKTLSSIEEDRRGLKYDALRPLGPGAEIVGSLLSTLVQRSLGRSTLMLFGDVPSSGSVSAGWRFFSLRYASAGVKCALWSSFLNATPGYPSAKALKAADLLCVVRLPLACASPVS